MLPAICLHARISFRRLDPERREEAVQNCIANAMIAYARLFELGRVELAYPSILANYAVAQTRDFRVVGSSLCIHDVLGGYCQTRKNVVVKRLDHHDRETNEWKEILVADHRCGPFDIVRTKLDFAAWLQSLPLRLRRIARFLAAGQRTSDAARKFGVSEGRISQLRGELKRGWEEFVGDAPEMAVA
jgi:hypothetical protein